MDGKKILEDQIAKLQKMCAGFEEAGNYDAVCRLSETIGHLVEIRSNIKVEEAK